MKLLTKPPVSAWAVNQLYWNHRDEFEQLIATGKRFYSAQASRSAAKAANMRDSLDARRQALVGCQIWQLNCCWMQVTIRRRTRCIASPQRSRRCLLMRCFLMAQLPAV